MAGDTSDSAFRPTDSARRSLSARLALPYSDPMQDGEWGVSVSSRLAATGRNALRSLRSLRLNGRPGPDSEARGARAPSRCAARQLRRANDQRPNSQQPNTEQPAPPQPARRFSAVGCLAAGPVERREAQGLGTARASARSSSSSARLFERSERSEPSEFAPRPQDRASQGTLAKGQGAEVGPCSLLPFLHEQERESPAGATSRRGLTQCDQPSRRAQVGLALGQKSCLDRLDAEVAPSGHGIDPSSEGSNSGQRCTSSQ